MKSERVLRMQECCDSLKDNSESLRKCAEETVEELLPRVSDVVKMMMLAEESASMTHLLQAELGRIPNDVLKEFFLRSMTNDDVVKRRVLCIGEGLAVSDRGELFCVKENWSRMGQSGVFSRTKDVEYLYTFTAISFESLMDSQIPDLLGSLGRLRVFLDLYEHAADFAMNVADKMVCETQEEIER